MFPHCRSPNDERSFLAALTLFSSCPDIKVSRLHIAQFVEQWHIPPSGLSSLHQSWLHLLCFAQHLVNGFPQHSIDFSVCHSKKKALKQCRLLVHLGLKYCTLSFTCFLPPTLQILGRLWLLTMPTTPHYNKWKAIFQEAGVTHLSYTQKWIEHQLSLIHI